MKKYITYSKILNDAQEIDETLKLMFVDLNESGELYSPSPFWQKLNDWGIRILKCSKLNNFKRTLNMHYFNWNMITIFAHQFFPILFLWLKKPDWTVFSTHFPSYKNKNRNIKSFNFLSAWIYKVYVSMFWSILEREDNSRLCSFIEEPSFGEPYTVYYKKKKISQDLCNSIHEYYSIFGRGKIEYACVKNICEIGAGYGRLAYVFLKAIPDCKYTIIDIPPALFVAQEYLSRVFPEKKIFKFRSFVNFNDVRSEFDSCQIRFLSSRQIELLDGKIFDLMINISSLHEMTLAQIKNYLYQINRIARGYFYLKQWQVSRAKVNGFTIREKQYPIPSSWLICYKEEHPVQKLFFHALYKIL